MYEIVQDFTHDIFSEKEGPFISLYQSTQKAPTEVSQDIIKFKNLVKELEASLSKKYSESDIKTLLEPFYEMKDDRPFWNDNREAIAVFATPKNSVVFRLSQPVKDKAIVANSFHTKPLIRHFQTRGTFDVLTINRESFNLYTCTRDRCMQVAFEEETPTTKEAVLGTLDEEGYLSHGSYNGASGNTMYHGHEDARAMTEKDTERFFRYVDHFVYDTYSKPTKRPLVLWALPEYHHVFRKVSKNSYLVDEGVKHSDNELKESLIRKEAWKIIEPKYKEEINTLIDKYEHAKSKGLASDSINDIANHAIKNNVDKIIIEAEKIIPGKLNVNGGSIIQGSLNDPTYDDVLDDLAEIVYQHGGKVYVLEDEDMPTNKGIAAIYRY